MKLITLILLFSISSFGMNFDINGVISDSVTGNPIEGAVVSLKNAQVKDTTDSNGRYELAGSVTSVSNVRFAELNISNGILTVISNKKVTVSVYQLNGKLVKELSGNSGKFKLPDIKDVGLLKVSVNNKTNWFKYYNGMNFTINGPSILAKTSATLDTLVVSHDLYNTIKIPITSLTTTINVDVPKKTVVYSSFKDGRDGTVYKTLKIGGETWFAEDLKYKPYTSGIFQISSYIVYQWERTTSDSSSNKKDICPVGWHVSTYDNWVKLKATFKVDGKYIDDKMKASGINLSNMGYRIYYNNTGKWIKDKQAYWYTTSPNRNKNPLKHVLYESEAKTLGLNADMNIDNTAVPEHPEYWYLSVRCVKDG